MSSRTVIVNVTRVCRQVVGSKPELRYAGGRAPSPSWDEVCGRPEPEVSTETPDFTLADLAKRVKERAQASADVSYTRKLLDKGVAHCAKKFGEEAVEAILAAVAEDRERVISEAADVLYHLVVMLEARGIEIEEVEAALANRTGQSGLQEKASRPRD